MQWDAERAAKLPAVVERMELEPHPVSGEVEIEDVQPAKYRRLDEETLQSRLELEQFELLPIYMWYEADEHGGTGPGWKLAELRSLEDIIDGTEWYDTSSQANDAASKQNLPVPQPSSGRNGLLQAANSHGDGSDNDDDYWASYDRTPGRGTPAQKQSPAPRAMTSTQGSNGQPQPSQSELDYYARYGTEVQPALDSHDPDEEHPETGQSTLKGDSLVETARSTSQPNGTSLYPAEPQQQQQAQDSTLDQDIEAPRPVSPTSSHNSSIERLEAQAAAMSEAPDDRAQLAIKQHISTDIKSLFRLAKSAGMERTDFTRIVKTELECLSLLEQDE